jgi:hypothetical protein
VWIETAKDGHTACADMREMANGFFEFMWIQVTAGTDNHILGAPGEIHFARRNVRQIAGIEPGPVKELRRGVRVMQISTGRRRATKLQAALLPLRDFIPEGIHDTNLMAR